MVEVVNSVEALTQKMNEMKVAQREFAAYSQEQVDKIFFAAAMAANAKRIPLAKMAVAETGMGIVEDKVIKNHYASEYIFNAYRDTKTCGVIEEDKAYGIKKIAEPIGLIAAVIPTTNPTSTAIFKTLLALKTRNAIKTAYINLIISKKDHKITIAELSREANIDRKTFYLHYNSLDDVLTTIVQEHLSEFKQLGYERDSWAGVSFDTW